MSDRFMKYLVEVLTEADDGDEVSKPINLELSNSENIF